MTFGLQSLTCFEISATVYKGFTVVAMAPIATTAKKQMGNWIELGAKMRTTSFFLIPSWLMKAWESLATVDLNWEKVRVWPESASMRAGLSE